MCGDWGRTFRGLEQWGDDFRICENFGVQQDFFWFIIMEIGNRFKGNPYEKGTETHYRSGGRLKLPGFKGNPYEKGTETTLRLPALVLGRAIQRQPL